MNRRTLLTAATWSAPVVLTACTTPAYVPSHDCTDACTPVVTCRKIQHPSGIHYGYRAETKCPYTTLARTHWTTAKREDVQVVGWTRRGEGHVKPVVVQHERNRR